MMDHKKWDVVPGNFKSSVVLGSHITYVKLIRKLFHEIEKWMLWRVIVCACATTAEPVPQSPRAATTELTRHGCRSLCAPEPVFRNKRSRSSEKPKHRS